MAAGSGHRSTPLEEVRERFRAAEEAEPGRDRRRYVEALKAFLATAEHHADAIADEGREIAPLLDEAAMAFYRASNPELAARAVELGLRLSPGTATLLHHKALVLLALNRDLPEVVRLTEEALTASPNDRGLWATRGDALRLLGRPGDAAEAYVRAQELDLASTEYVDKALKIAPHHPRALRMKVELARARGGDLSALSAAEELLTKNPTDPSLQLARAELLASVGRRDEALEAVRALPEDAGEARRLLEVRLLFDLGKGDEALPIGRALVDAAPSPGSATLETLARVAGASHPELALAARERLAVVDPRNVQNLTDLRLLAVSLGQVEAALAACRSILTANPENLEAMRAIADIEASAGRAGPALEAYRALALAHPSAVGDLRKALALARSLSREQDVRELAEAILAVEPTDADARAELAHALAVEGDSAAALAEYDELLRAHPGDLGVLLAKRDLLASSGDRAALAPVLDELFRLDPTRTDVAVERGHLNLANAYDLPEGSTERTDAARAALVCYERASTDPEARNVSLLGIARASRVIEDHDRALSAYTEFLGHEENANRWDIRKERAHTLREAGRLTEAAQEYERVIGSGLDDPDLLWGAGETYARLGQTATALRLLDVLLRREPKEPMYLRRKGQLLLAAGRRDEGLAILQHAVEGAERDPQAYFEVAEALRAQGAYPDAVTYFQRGLEIDPRSRHGRLALAETFLLAGRYPDVLGLVDPLLKEDPNDLAAWKARADAWRALGRPSEVLYSLEAILLLDPDSGQGLLEMYRLRRERGETKEAYEALDRLLKGGAAEAQEPTLHLELGDLAAALGLPDPAHAAYEKAAALDPAMRVEIAIRRARLRQTAGRPDLALEVLDSTLHGDGAPTAPSVAALLLRAELLASMERPAEARAAFEEVRKREPRSPTAAGGIARSMITEGRHADAVAFLGEALPQLPPEDGNVLLLAEAQAALGHLDAAQETLVHGLETLPRSVALWSRLGEVGIARQAWPDAASAFAHALAITPNAVDLLLRAGFVAERLNHPNEAVTYYQRATEAEPTHAQAWTSRGLALLATGRPAEAAASFERALSIDSDFAPAKDGKRLAAERTRSVEVQRYGREALLLEARLNRTVTKNDLFVQLHVPYDFLSPVLREIGQVPKVDLARLAPEELRDLDSASYQLISAALERRPAGIEKRGFTLADVAALSPPNATLEQMQRLFGYLRAVLEAELKPEQLTLSRESEELARKALGLPPEGRTLFQLVRTLRVGVYQARLIKAVEEAGSTTGTRAPALDLGAYSPEFRPAPAAPAAAAEAPAAPAARKPPAPAPGGAAPAPTGAARPSPQPTGVPPGAVTARAGDRCIGCGGIASVVHVCGAPLCQTCLAQFPTCPKCDVRIVPGTTRPIPGVAPPAPSAHGASAPPTDSAGGGKGAPRRGPKTVAEPPPPAPTSLNRPAAPRHAPPHRVDHERAAKPPAPSEPTAPATPVKKAEPASHEGKGPAAEPAAPNPKAPAPEKEEEGADAGGSAEKTGAPAKARPAKTDDEPRL